MKKQYTKIKKIEASIIELDKVEDIAYNAVVKVNTLGENFIGQVVKIDDDTVTVEVFGNTQDFSLNDIVVEFEEKPLEIPLNESSSIFTT